MQHKKFKTDFTELKRIILLINMKFIFLIFISMYFISVRCSLTLEECKDKCKLTPYDKELFGFFLISTCTCGEHLETFITVSPDACTDTCRERYSENNVLYALINPLGFRRVRCNCYKPILRISEHTYYQAHYYINGKSTTESTIESTTEKN